MLKIHDLSFSYGKKQVLRNFSLQINNGEIVAVMGASGCGKSTLLQLIAGLLTPTSGKIEHDLHGISYAFQEPRLFPWLTVEENLKAVLSKDQADADQIISRALETVELSDSKCLYPDSLSGGMKSRASLARALTFGGELFLLDEPFAGIDPIAVNDIKTMVGKLTQRGIGVLITDHNVRDTLEITNRAIIISSGQIVAQGSQQEILQSEVARKIYLGEEFKM